MENFSLPASVSEWPPEEYFVDDSELEDIDAVLERVASAIEKRPESLHDRHNFGVLLSLIKSGSNLRADNRSRILNALKTGSQTLSLYFLRNRLHWPTLPDCETLEKNFVQTLKAYVFLLERIILNEEQELKNQKENSSEEAAMPAKRKGKKQAHSEASKMAQQGRVSIWHIEKNREEILAAMVSLIDIPLVEVWNPDIALLNLFSNLSFHLLENPLNSKSQVIRNGCIALLRPLVALYRHSSDVVLRTLHAFRQSDLLVSGIVDLVKSMKSENNVLPFINELLRELAKIPVKDVSNNQTLAKNVERFVSELCSTVPKLVIPCVSLLISNLEHEAYVVRSGVLSGLGFLVVDGFKDERPADERDDEEKSKKRQAEGEGKTNDTEEENLEEEESAENDVVAPPAHATLDAILDILTERLLDANAFTRARAVQVWSQLALRRAIPISRYLAITECTVRRLNDKTANVRKASMELLHDLIENNPYGPNLSLKLWKKKLEDLEVKMQEINRQLEPISRSQEASEMPPPLPKAKKSKAYKSSKSKKRLVEEEEEEQEEEEVADKEPEDKQNEAEQQPPVVPTLLSPEQLADLEEQKTASEKAWKHFTDTIEFIGWIQKALPCVSALLGSKSVGDVTEAIKMLSKAHTFKIDESVDGIRTVLQLVCSKEPGIKEAAIQAYIDLYLTPPSDISRIDIPVFIARNLIALTINATLGELTSLGVLIHELASADRISASLLPVLWSYFEFKPDQRCGAIIILSMLYDNFPDWLNQRIPQMMKIGFGPECCDNPMLAKWTCLALQKLKKPDIPTIDPSNEQDQDKDGGDDSDEAEDEHEDGHRDNKQSKNSKSKKGKKSAAAKSKTTGRIKKKSQKEESKPAVLPPPWDASSIRTIANLLTLTGQATPPKSSKSLIETTAWYSVAEAAVNAIYYLSDAPVIVMAEVLKRLAISLSKSQEAASTGGAYQSRLSTSTSDAMEPTDDVTDSQRALQLRQAGSVSSSLGRIIFLLGHVAMRQLVFIEDITGERQKQKSQRKAEKKSSQDEAEYEAIELELGAVGTEAAGESHEEERARLYSQHAMVSTRLIGQFLPVVVNVIRSQIVRKSDAALHGVAVLTLAKCLFCSQDLCKTHWDIIESILSDPTVDPSVKKNVVIFLGDVAMRFPNLFEDRANGLYARLDDLDASVRKTALVVVSHLVLTNMVKPRGHMSDISVCLEDRDSEVVDAAKLFFRELAAKDNALISLLPDTISSLYRKDLEFDKAKSILQYLLSFVDLQRDLVSLVDKLCQQFSNSPEVRSWRYLSYCLSMMNHNEASIERLHSHFKFYKNALHDQVTSAFFLQAVRNRRSKTTEGKSAADTLEEKILAIQEGVFVEATDADNPEGITLPGTKGKKGGKRTANKRKKKTGSLESEELDDTEAPPFTKRKVRPKRAAAPRRRKEEYSDEEDDDIPMMDEDSD